MIITDLDGTLFSHARSLSKANIDTLEELGKRNIVRVVATGRSLYSTKKLISDDFPIDYLIFSTGAGIVNWKTKDLLYKNSLNSQIVSQLVDVFIFHKINFMLHLEIPDNHYFFCYKGDSVPGDYLRRVSLYSDFATPYSSKVVNDIKASQFVIILPNIDEYKTIKNITESMNSTLSYIQTTSPLNGESVWLEIFSEGINKSYAANYLAETLSIPREKTLTVGNDWNDEDLLEWGGASYVMDNAPRKLKKKYRTLENTQADGFAKAVKDCLETDEW